MARSSFLFFHAWKAPSNVWFHIFLLISTNPFPRFFPHPFQPSFHLFFHAFSSFFLTTNPYSSCLHPLFFPILRDDLLMLCFLLFSHNKNLSCSYSLLFSFLNRLRSTEFLLDLFIWRGMNKRLNRSPEPYFLPLLQEWLNCIFVEELIQRAGVKRRLRKNIFREKRCEKEGGKKGIPWSLFLKPWLYSRYFDPNMERYYYSAICANLIHKWEKRVKKVEWYYYLVENGKEWEGAWGQGGEGIGGNGGGRARERNFFIGT